MLNSINNDEINLDSSDNKDLEDKNNNADLEADSVTSEEPIAEEPAAEEPAAEEPAAEDDADANKKNVE